MASLTIRNLEDPVKARLRVRAAQNGRSMEEEARHILRATLSENAPQGKNLGETIRRRFAPFGGVELEMPRREPVREPPDFNP